MNGVLDERTGVIAYLAENSPAAWIGRTALMKYLYFMQVLRDVPLGYDFSLYSYGPFDSAVLSDLGNAEALGIVNEKIAFYPSGYGYCISSAMPIEQIQQLGGGLLQRHVTDADWVIKEFGHLSAADLELSSTIVYTDREAYRSLEAISLVELARRVRDVKPHFTYDQVVRHAEVLRNKGLLKAVRDSHEGFHRAI
jgi:uncharacterized protein